MKTFLAISVSLSVTGLIEIRSVDEVSPIIRLPLGENRKFA